MIKKPNHRPTTQEARLYKEIALKQSMVEKFLKKADDLIDKNPSEARQCLQTAQNLKAELQELQKPLKQEEPKEDKPIIQNNDNDPKPSPFSSDYKQWKERHPEYTSPRITRRDGEKSIFSDMVWSAEEQTWIKPKPEEKVIEEPPLSNTEEPRRPLLKRRK